MFQTRAMILQADSHDASIVKNSRVTIVTQQFRHLHEELLLFMDLSTRSDVTAEGLCCSQGR